jgi:hypothetical protein
MVDLFLDSGAHSLYMKLKLKGSSFSQDEYDSYFKEYIKFIKENEKYLTIYVNLDIINDPVRSMANYKRMRKEGLKPIAVVHPGEDYIWITKYLELGCEYVGLGGLGQFYTKTKYINWADVVWSKALTDKKGFPLAKCHGFAMTSFDLMFRYPWWSVDSTTWVMVGRFGSVLIPKFRNGKFIYTEAPWSVMVSNQSPDVRNAGKHISTFAPMEQDIIKDYLKLKGIKLGKSEYRKEDKTYKLKKGERWAGEIELDLQREDGVVQEDHSLVETIIEAGVCNDYRLRDEVNIVYYLDLEKHFPKWPWAFKLNQKELSKGFGLMK